VCVRVLLLCVWGGLLTCDGLIGDV
jgi:hypothetical protein